MFVSPFMVRKPAIPLRRGQTMPRRVRSYATDYARVRAYAMKYKVRSYATAEKQ